MVTGAPPGYGYTGTLSVHYADAHGCPTQEIASQPWLPTTGSNVMSWKLFLPWGPLGWCLVFTNAAVEGSPVVLYTDRPAAGPTGPQACGTCYPADRSLHSFLYGTASSPHCPGLVFFDGTCAAELIWATLGDRPCTTPDCLMNPVEAGASLQTSSWGRVKSLYR